MVTKKIIVLFMAISAITFSSCSSEDDGVIAVSGNRAVPSYSKLADGTEQIVTDKGEVIHITDTTVYYDDSYEIRDVTDTIDLWESTLLTRANNNYPYKMTVKGYDQTIKSGGNMKMMFTKDAAKKYGLYPNTVYIVCDYIVTKELSQGEDESIKPRDYTNNLDDTPMGWSVSKYNQDKSMVKGFDVASIPVNGFVTASTLLRYVICDAGGASYNKYIPYTPSSLTWQYVLSYSPGWD